MSRLAKYVALLAAVGVLVVLITPIADELPCTTWHGHQVFAVALNTIAILVFAMVLSEIRLRFERRPAFSGTDLLFLTCTLLC